MQRLHGPKPDTVEQYLEIYEALDTMREDSDALATTRSELLPDCVGDSNDLATLNAEVAREQTLIEERRRYVLSTVIGRSALHSPSIQAASMAYVGGFESPDGQQNAAWRVWVYNRILTQVWHTGAVPQKRPSEMMLDDPGRDVQDVRIYGRTDPATGRTWVSLTDPRGVEHGEPVREGDKVIAEYEIADSHVNGVGERVVVITSPGMPDRTVAFAEGSKVWRVNAAGRLELFIPANRSSIGEYDLSSLERLLSSLNQITQVAVQAAGADLPSIFDTFNDQRGNPRTLPVAKRD